MSELEEAYKRIRDLEELVSSIPARWASPPRQRTSGWASLKEDLLNGQTADAQIEDTSTTIEVVDYKSLIGAGKKLAQGSWVFFAENTQGKYVLIQSRCPVDE